MAIFRFEVPEKLGGRTLRDIGGEFGLGRTDLIAGKLGLGEFQPLRAGQQFNIPIEPAGATWSPGSTEMQGLMRIFPTVEAMETQRTADRAKKAEEQRVALLAQQKQEEAERARRVEASRLALLAQQKQEEETRLRKAEESRQAFLTGQEQAEAERLRKLEEGRLALLTGQEQVGEEFLGRFRGAISGFEPLAAIRERLSGELGLPSLRETATGLQEAAIDLETTLARMPEQVEAQTRGFDVNAAQLAAIQRREQAETGRTLADIARQAERAGGRLVSTEQELGARLGLEAAEQQRQLIPFETEIGLISERLGREASLYGQAAQTEAGALASRLGREATLYGQGVQTETGLLSERLGREAALYGQEAQTEAAFLSDRLAREVTLYGQDKQAELSELLTKLQIQGNLDIAEMNRVSQLAMQEKEFEFQRGQLEKELALQEKRASITTPREGTFTTAGGRKLLVDPVTGNVIADLGSSTAGTAGAGVAEGSLEGDIDDIINQWTGLGMGELSRSPITSSFYT